MHIAIEDLRLNHLFIIFPGTMKFSVTDHITACGFELIEQILQNL